MPPVQGDDGLPSGFTPRAPFGVWGDSGILSPVSGGNGVVGSSAHGSGVHGVTLSDNNRAAGVFGNGPQVGVAGYVNGSASAPSEKVGVYGSALGLQELNGIGVMGESFTNSGVHGNSVFSYGVHGTSRNGSGVQGESRTSAGVAGLSPHLGVFGSSAGTAGLFDGHVRVTGVLTKGGGGFAIDHPLDPANRYLRHSFVESPDMKNVYDGVAVCDERGEAVVMLPAWFQTLNEEYRYQLCPIGAAAPSLHIAAEVANNRFTIGGGAPGLKVSWQVTGIRKDPWARENRIVTDEEKETRGTYLHPEVYGEPRERGVVWEMVEGGSGEEEGEGLREAVG